MAKNLDGIKKLNREEIKKNRKMVLGYVGGKDLLSSEERRSAGPAFFASNNVDGIRLNKISGLKLKVKNVPEKPAPSEDDQASKREKNERSKKAEKELAEKAELQAKEMAEAEATRRRQEKARLEEKLREGKRIVEEKKRLEKIKRTEEIKRIKQEIKSAKMAAAAKRKIKRRKAIKSLKKKLNDKLGGFFSAVEKNIIYGTLYLVTFLIISYVVFCLLALRLKAGNGFIGEMTRILPVPAAVTGRGIINYYDFLVLKNNDYGRLSLAEKKNILAEWIILKNLREKYGLPVDSSGEALAAAFAGDGDFNQTGLSRIKKIGELLKNADDLEQLSKYADEYSDVVYYDSASAAKKFGPAVLNLSANQTGGIIFRDNGYYIAQVVADKNGQLGVKYLFVGAKTLNQYVKEESAKIKIFILAN